MKINGFRAAVATVFAACVVVNSGCGAQSEKPSDEPTSAEVLTTTAPKTEVTPITSTSPMPDTTESQPISKDEPTVFVGPDGEIIYSSEVTAIDGSDKKAAELTETDYWTSVLCEGFQYFTLPSGVAYDNYHNPEMFDGIVYCSQAEENKNNCQRLNVGEELCGLKLVSAASEFKIEDYEDTPDPYYYDGYLFGDESEKFVAEFEGEIEIVGFLGVTAANAYEPDGGSMFFTPTESKLPILGNKPEFYERMSFGGAEYCVYSDMQDLQCGYIQELECSSAGLEQGDMALVRLTLSEVKYKNSFCVIGKIENIELISEILFHEQGSF